VWLCSYQLLYLVLLLWCHHFLVPVVVQQEEEREREKSTRGGIRGEKKGGGRWRGVSGHLPLNEDKKSLVPEDRQPFVGMSEAAKVCDEAVHHPVWQCIFLVQQDSNEHAVGSAVLHLCYFE